jgi:hypothetical protein
VPVQVTVKGRRKLVRIVRAGTSPQRLVLRAKIVLAAADGQANAQIARDLGCSVAVVRTWRGRFTVRGIPGLLISAGPGGRRPTAPATGSRSWRSRHRFRGTASRSGRTP